MKFRRMLSFILSVAMVFTIMPQPVQVSAAAKVYNINTSDIDASAPGIAMTDEQFFAKINLSAMPAVNSAVSVGNYALAKKSFLHIIRTNLLLICHLSTQAKTGG